MQRLRRATEKLSWDDVRLFLALCRWRTVGAAASALGIDASTVSRRLAGLEKTLSATLFDRGCDRVAPTETAERLMPIAEEIEEVMARLACEAEGLSWVAPQNAESIPSARLRAEQQPEATLREQADLLNLTHDAILVRDMNGTIRYWNRGAEELYGWPAEQAVGRVIQDMLKAVLPAPLDQIEAELVRAGRWEGEILDTKKDGSQIVVASRWSLQRDDHGRTVAVLETNNDITERKRAQEQREKLRQLEADLARINRANMMGELAASLAHEIKQPITAAATNARTCLRWLQRDPPEIGEARETALRIVKDVNHAADIINRLRSLYTRGVQQRELLDVNNVIDEMTFLFGDEARRYSIPIHNDLARDLPKIMADRVQLQQVFMNLMLNAIEAMKDTGGKLTIKSGQAEDGQMLISISDTGAGLPTEKLDQIFNAFFTTKPQGTGMGLAITRSIIEAHGGRLWASANTGRGATFHFALPTQVKASSNSAG